jgi:replicative DNA helicase
VVFDLALRRDLIRIGGEIASTAPRRQRKDDVNAPARDQIEAAEQQPLQPGRKRNGLVGLRVVRRRPARRRRDDRRGLQPRRRHVGGRHRPDRSRPKIGGLHPSDLVVLAGRPSMGKTALATNIAFNIARKYA